MYHTTKSKTVVAFLIVGLFLWGCSAQPTDTTIENTMEAESSTTTDTTNTPEKNPLFENCKVYFDGCNNCQVLSDGGLACTRIFCETLEEPKCLEMITPEVLPPVEPMTKSEPVSYLCDDNKTFTVEFLGAAAENANFTDAQTGATIALEHTVSGSGAKYENTKENMTFWSKGDTAFVLQGEIDFYTNCNKQ